MAPLQQTSSNPQILQKKNLATISSERINFHIDEKDKKTMDISKNKNNTNNNNTDNNDKELYHSSFPSSSSSLLSSFSSSSLPFFSSSPPSSSLLSHISTMITIILLCSVLVLSPLCQTADAAAVNSPSIKTTTASQPPIQSAENNNNNNKLLLSSSSKLTKPTQTVSSVSSTNNNEEGLLLGYPLLLIDQNGLSGNNNNNSDDNNYNNINDNNNNNNNNNNNDNNNDENNNDNNNNNNNNSTTNQQETNNNNNNDNNINNIIIKNNNNNNSSATATNNNSSSVTADELLKKSQQDEKDEKDKDEKDEVAIMEKDNPLFSMETFVTISVTLLIILTNCTIIIVAAWTEAFSNFNKIFIYSMSLADLLIGLFVTPYSVFLSVFRRWVFASATVCNILAYVLLTLHGARLYSITWLSVDHHIAVRKPERYKVMMSRTRSVCWIIISWLASICFCMPPMLSYKSSFFNRSIFLCQADTQRQIAYILTSVLLVSLPAGFTLLITNIYLFTKSYKKRISFYEKVFVELSTRPWNYHVTFVMCAVTVFLWLPFCLLQFFGQSLNVALDGRAEFYLCWLGFCCSFSNFFVLFWMCTPFRKAVKDMYSVFDWCPTWCCCCRRKHQRAVQYNADVNLITFTSRSR